MTFNNDIELAKFIQSLGGTLWQVGGSVRDELLGKVPKDRDYVITGVEVEDLPFDKIVGQSFPVFKVKIGNETCEVAMARTENRSGKGYHGFTFNTSPNISIEQDLKRRETTMNSIAKNVLTSEIVDPYGGIADIKKKIIRHTSEAFIEDPVRAIRVARFAMRMNDFKVAEETIDLLKTMKNDLKWITPERIWKELEEVLNNPKPSIFFKVLKEAELLDVWFPEIAILINIPDMHDGTVFNHLMTVIDNADTPLVRFGLLTHDFGKALTPKEEWPKHHGHDSLGEEAVIKLCNRLKCPTEYREFGILCATQHMKAHRLYEFKSGKLVRWVLQNKKYINDLMKVVMIDGAYREGVDREEAIKEWNYLRDLVDLALKSEKDITGKALIAQGFDSSMGKKFGEVLYQKRVQDFMKKRKEYEQTN